jgi:hypothetical protein
MDQPQRMELDKDEASHECDSSSLRRKPPDLCNERSQKQTEYDSQQASIVLRARTVRCVDGLDLIKYEHALKTQRQYLSSRLTDT